jgi:RNA-directed DNA polymerase
MNGHGKSDDSVVPAKPPNNDPHGSAEVVEERGSTEGNVIGKPHPGLSAGHGVSHALDRVRKVAGSDKKARFTALLHHVSVEHLREAYRAINPKAAAGVDALTWEAYGEDLDENIQALHRRVHEGAYRAKPSRRVYIPKSNGTLRPLGIAAIEDKILQRAVTSVMEAIYESDFLGFSYGFRPGRGPHDALDALWVACTRRKVNWVLDADIRDFFTRLDHGWLIRFIEHRIADKRMVRLVQKWLKAGVIDDGVWAKTRDGTPQGAPISPLLANVYLHYVFDLWADRWRKRQARGDVVVVRYADDFIVGFQHEDDARRFLEELHERFARFGLELSPDKTRLIEFGRFADQNRRRRGRKKPETFDFLGFTHICAKDRNGRFSIRRVTSAKRMRGTLRRIKDDLAKRRHLSISAQGRWLHRVVMGYRAYYAVPGNGKAVQAFRAEVTRHWHRALRRRSQRDRLTWTRMGRITKRWLPSVTIAHPYPNVRFDAKYPR